MKLSFVQRLSLETINNDSKIRSSGTSLEKIIESQPKVKKIAHLQFEQHHNELKNILKIFDKPKNPEISMTEIKRPGFQQKECKIKYRDLNKSELILKENIPKQKQQLRQIEERPLHKSNFLAKSEVYLKKGIANIGNTCYINAIIQCLFHLPKFNEYFEKEQYLNGKKSCHETVVEFYKKLYINLMKNSSSTIDISTRPLKMSVSKICSLFVDWEQQDAHQFMRQLLNSMHDEINRVTSKTAYKLIKHTGHSLDKLATQYWQYYKARDDSYIYDHLCGQLYNSVKCINCGHLSQSFDNFLDLSMPIVSGLNSIDQLLENFFAEEKLADFYFCENCKKSSKKSVKCTSLWRAPRFLILHLKRSQFGKKNMEPITFALDCLSLKPYIRQSNDKSAKYSKYCLSGVVMHKGASDGGHYWSNVRENGRWYEIDDEKVKQIGRDKLLSLYEKQGCSSSYILFYSSLHN